MTTIYVVDEHQKMYHTCPNCLQETKVVLVDLNLFNKKGGKIKFKRCKRTIKKDFCLTLILDKISINIEKLKW